MGGRERGLGLEPALPPQQPGELERHQRTHAVAEERKAPGKLVAERRRRALDELGQRRERVFLTPLVEVIDAPNGPFHRDTHPTVPLVVLTEEGREHYARHHDEYRRAYPELDLPRPAPEEQDV